MPNFTAIDPHILTYVIGGQANPNDFAGRYVDQLKQDRSDLEGRILASDAAYANGDYGGFAKHRAAAGLNLAGMVGDAIAPINAIRG